MKIIFTGNNTKIGKICWDTVRDYERVNYSRTTGWNLDYPQKVDELLEEEFDVLVSVAKTNQYYLIQKFYEKFRDTNKRLIVLGSRASEWSGKPIPHHGMKYAIDKKCAFDGVRFIQNDTEKKCIAQILNIGKSDDIEEKLEQHFKYVLENKDVLDISVWGV